MEEKENIIDCILPKWVVAILKDWHLKKRTGSLKLDYSDGGVRAVNRSDRVEPKKKR